MTYTSTQLAADNTTEEINKVAMDLLMKINQQATMASEEPISQTSNTNIGYIGASDITIGNSFIFPAYGTWEYIILTYGAKLGPFTCGIFTGTSLPPNMTATANLRLFYKRLS